MASFEIVDAIMYTLQNDPGVVRASVQYLRKDRELVQAFPSKRPVKRGYSCCEFCGQMALSFGRACDCRAKRGRKVASR